MLHCAILRSPHPHARIVRIDTSRAEAHPGVAAVLTGADLERWCNPMVTAPAGWGPYSLAVGKVRFVGEPVAAVAASSRYIAEDACELIDVEYELLPVVADPCVATDPGSALLYEENGTNLMLDRAFTWGDIDGVFAAADQVFSAKFRWNRVGANPTETFGCVCQWDLVQDRLTCHGAYQTPGFMALGRAHTLKLAANQVNIISHPQGGGFGGKGGPRGTDIAALLSRKAGGRPVKYIEDRMEYLLAGGGQSWDRYYDAALAVKADGTVTGFRVKLLDDQGASAEGYGTISVAKPLAAFTGCYRIEAAQYDVKVVSTNRAPSYPYRGYGPPPHNFVLESLMDIAARGLGLDTAEIRRRNYIRPDQFPYTIPSGNEYDSGNYEAALDKVLEMADYRRLREEQARARAEGRLVGHRRRQHHRAGGVRLERLCHGRRARRRRARGRVAGHQRPRRDHRARGLQPAGAGPVHAGRAAAGRLLRRGDERGARGLCRHRQRAAALRARRQPSRRGDHRRDPRRLPDDHGEAASRGGGAAAGAVRAGRADGRDAARQGRARRADADGAGRRRAALAQRPAAARAWRRVPPRPASGPRRGAPHPTTTDAARATSRRPTPATWCWSRSTPRPARPRS